MFVFIICTSVIPIISIPIILICEIIIIFLAVFIWYLILKKSGNTIKGIMQKYIIPGDIKPFYGGVFLIIFSVNLFVSSYFLINSNLNPEASLGLAIMGIYSGVIFICFGLYVVSKTTKNSLLEIFRKKEKEKKVQEIPYQ